jgi:Uma2 family endonuclease
MDAAARSRPLSTSDRVSLRVGPVEIHGLAAAMSDAEFEALCAENPDLRIEQDPSGNITIMAPVSYDSGNFESEVNGDLVLWNRRTRLGKTFSPSTAFVLPDGSKRMPDAAWISLEKHRTLSPEERKKFAAVVPDFVVEVRSPSDDLEQLREKMTAAWIANGVRLAWLLDPVERRAWIYRANGSIDVIEDFARVLSGEDVLPDFQFDLAILQNDNLRS